jgi:hypothetical protein
VRAVLSGLRGLVLRHRNHGAGEHAVGLSQLIQNSVVNSLLFIVRQNRTSPELLAEHYEPSGFRVPITLLVLDQTSEAAIITIDAERRMVVH